MRVWSVATFLLMSGPLPAQYLPPNCVTQCWARARLGPQECSDLRAAERKILMSYALRVPEYKRTCLALDGWTIKVHDFDTPTAILCHYPAWLGRRGKCIEGYTFLEQKVVEVPTSDFGHNAFAHELAHVLDQANGRPSGHCKWEEAGIRRAIREVNAADNPAQNDCGPVDSSNKF